jgi:hypothetical protein
MQDKFISFDGWWGGWNNTRMCIEMLGAMSYVSGRKIILPPSMYILFLSEHDDKNSFFDIWKILDKEAFIQNFDCVEYYDTNLTKYSNKRQWFEGINKDIKCIMFGDDYKEWGPQNFINQGIIVHTIEDENHYCDYAKNKKKYNIFCEDETIHFPRNLLGHFGVHVYPPNDIARRVIQDKVKHGIKFRKEYEDSAKELIQGDYDAIHIRRNDFLGVHTDLVNNQYKNLLNLLEGKVRKEATLYIATDEKDLNMFDFLKETYKIIFLKDLTSDLKIHEPLILDTIICSNAKTFLGSRMSTYSDYINILRGYKGKIDTHRKGINFDRGLINYKKYPWEAEPYAWHDLWGELYYGKI